MVIAIIIWIFNVQFPKNIHQCLKIRTKVSLYIIMDQLIPLQFY
jgi:hypothetical protein